ncbi:MAG: tetratricopeptide repeat protein [Chloroflexota bacterium]|nr:tetratricopeptide repeat protein [Chloroflexota bacterium]
MTTVSTVAAFLTEIESYGDAVYRGQAKAEWRVDCSAARRLAPGAKGEDLGKVTHSLAAYTEILLRGALRHVGNCPELPPRSSELEILAQLQHQGAATGLIDFTTEALVALWFACNEHLEEDGAVYILPRSEVRLVAEPEARMHGVMKYFEQPSVREDRLYLWSPRGLQGRPASQASVFVFGRPFLWPRQLWKVVVAQASKPALLAELQAEHGLAADTLFPDLAGYGHANSVSKPFGTDRIVRNWEDRVAEIPGDRPRSMARAYVCWGIAYGEAGQLDQAIERFTEAISLDPRAIDAHVNRAWANSELGNFEDAIPDYDTAIEELETAGDTSEDGKEMLGRLYWRRGAACLRSDREDQACADLNKAVELGVTMWVVDKATGRPRVSAVPDSYLEYRD